ncbi:hypothetical protein [uncultured Vibrio sp.]|nr:hypothetical protein [uncultured Vibrio sp.]
MKIPIESDSIGLRFPDSKASPKKDIGRPILVIRARKRERFF